MAFTYDLTTSGDSLAVSKIRLEIGDTDNSTDAGIKPDGVNFTDAELLYFYNDEGDSILLGAARSCEVLSRMWAAKAEATKIREYSIDNRQKAKYYMDMAKMLRQQAGSTFISGSAPTTRVDGYSDSVNSQRSDATEGDYGAEVIKIRTR